MTRDDIIRMAREAGLGTALCHNSIDGDRIWIEGADWHEEVERFAALVAASEREACAKVCDAKVIELGMSRLSLIPGICAAKIRARSQA
jgi:hypothetical protein